MKRSTLVSRTSKLGLEELEPRIAPTAVIIADVPAYNWYRGCGPTAVGMILGYWDSNGYDFLVVGDASDTSGNLANIHDMIATQEHYDDYGNPSLNPDLSELGGAHENNSVADFMRTSQSYLSMSYGWSLFNYADNGLEEYAQYVGYSDAEAWNEAWYSDSLWDNIVNDIDAGYPVMLLVDTDGNGNADHFVPVMGYNDTTMEYACYNTWDSSVHWYDFALITADQPWAVYGATYFRPGTPIESLPVEVVLTLDPASDTGISSTDGLTSDNTPVFNVTVSTEGTISIDYDGDYIFDDVLEVDDAGTYQFEPGSPFSDGVHSLTAVFQPTNGEADGDTLDITVDTVAPSAPTVPDLVALSDTGILGTDNITSDATPTIDLTGFGTYYRLFRDGVQVSSDYDTSSTFTEVSALADGDHTYTLRAVDSAGNVSDASSVLTVTIDTVAPVMPDTPDLNALSDSGISDTDDITNDATPTLDLSGFGTYYRLYRDGVQVSGDYATASSYVEGSPLADGSYLYTLIAADPAGNESDASDALTLVVDTLGPAVADLTPTPGSIMMVSPTELTAVFNEVLDPTTVTSVNFQLVASGLDGTFDDGNETTIVPTSVDYDEATSTATFHLSEELPNDTYQIVLVGTNTIEDLAGNALDGGGEDHVSTFTVGVPELIIEDSVGLADDLYADLGFLEFASGTATATVTLTNTGTAALVIDSITMSDPVNYTIEWDGDGSEPTSIAADTQRVATITFDPAGLGAALATITIESNDPTQSTAIITVDATAYVCETWTEGGTTVTLVDVAGDLDLVRDNVAVRFGRDGAVSSIRLSGDLPMDGVGIIIQGAPSVGSITDSRRGEVGEVAFIVSDAPITNLRLKGPLSGHLLNGRTLEGVVFASDLDGDGDLRDLTAVSLSGDLRTLRVSGEVTGDVLVDGSVKNVQTTGALTGDLVISGDARNLRIGGHLGYLGGRVEIGGNLNRLALSSKVGPADLLSDLSVGGEARVISVGSRATGGSVLGDIEVWANVRNLTVAGSLTGDVTVHGDLNRAAIGGQLGSEGTTFTVTGALKNLTVGSRTAPADLLSDLLVTGDLNKASIHGDVLGQVTAEASVKNFTAQHIYSDLTVAGDLGSLRTASGILAGADSVDNLFSNDAGPNGSLTVAGEINRLREV